MARSGPAPQRLDATRRARLDAAHLVLLPGDTDPELVDRLVRFRAPHSRLLETGSGWLARSSTITGPFYLAPDDAIALRVDPSWELVYAVHTPRERDALAFEDIGDPQVRAWWMRAFPDGKPYREEGEAVDLALALARSLGGAVRPAGGQVTLVLDPNRGVDLTIWSTLPLSPNQMLAVLQPVMPGVHPQGATPDPREWRTRARPVDTSPWSVAPDEPASLDVASALSRDRLADIDAMSAAHDAYASAHDDGLDGYQLEGRDDVVVQAIAEDAVPPWIVARLGADDQLVLTYTVRWLPQNRSLKESEDLSPILRQARDRARQRVRAIARTLAEVTLGIITTSDGFEADRYQL